MIRGLVQGVDGVSFGPELTLSWRQRAILVRLVFPRLRCRGWLSRRSP